MYLKLQLELELSEILALVTGLPNLSERASRALTSRVIDEVGEIRGRLVETQSFRKNENVPNLRDFNVHLCDCAESKGCRVRGITERYRMRLGRAANVHDTSVFL